MTSVLFIVQIILVIALVIFVLLQKSQSMGLGAYSSSNDTVFGAQGPMNFLAKATMVLGFLLVLNTLTLTYLYNKQANTSVINEVKLPKSTSVPAAPVK